MKFYPPPIIRFCYRYLALAIFIGYPLYFTTVEAFDLSIVALNDRPFFVTIGIVMTIIGCAIVNFVFMEKCFSTLVLTETDIRWVCPLRKTIIMPITKCLEIGAYIENKSNGIPFEQIYFCDYRYPQNGIGLNGKLMASEHLIKFWYSEQLCDYIINRFSSRQTSFLQAYQHKRNK